MKYRMIIDTEVELIPIDDASTEQPPPTPPTVPLLEKWQDNMIHFGRRFAADMTSDATSYDQKLFGCLNYDGFRVFQQIKEYTGATDYDAALDACRAVYRDQYLASCNYRVPAHHNYTGGLTHDALAGNEQSRAAVLAVALNAPYCRDDSSRSATENASASRETAYAIMAMLNAEKLGAPRRPRLDHLIKHAFGHVDQWYLTRSTPYVRPFMVSLTCYAIMHCVEAGFSGQSVVEFAADELWKAQWLPDQKTFTYTDRIVSDPGDMQLAHDLNLLIAPVYAWLYSRTNNDKWRERADLLWEGGISRADLNNVKRFNQNYLHAFNFLKWRGAWQPK